MKKLALALLFVLPLASAKADVLETFNLNWSGARYGNSATVSAVLTLNMTTLAADNYLSMGDYSRDVSSLVMTVTGASSGNGTYYTNDFYNMYLTAGTNPPWASQYGRYVLNSASQGAITLDDINFFGIATSDPSPLNTTPGTTPYGIAPFELRLGSGQSVFLSGTSAVPEPSSYVMGFAGLLGMVGFASSRKKKSEAAVAV